jgi:hypothetical protein
MSREITWELVGIVRIYDFHMLLISPRQGKKNKYHHDGTRCLFLFFRLSASLFVMCVCAYVCFLFFFVQTLPYTSIRCISILDSRNSHPPFSLLLKEIMYNWLIFKRKQTQRWHNRDCVGFFVLFCFAIDLHPILFFWLYLTMGFNSVEWQRFPRFRSSTAPASSKNPRPKPCV